MKLNTILAKTWYNVFENEGEGGDDAGTSTSTDTATIQTDSQDQSSDGSVDDAAADKKTTTFTQEDLNKILAQEKRKHQATTQKALNELDAIRKKASLTEKERHELDERVDRIQNDMRTKEEQAKRQQEMLRKAHNERIQGLEAERDTWRTRFTTSTIERSITDAAVLNNSFNPRQIVAILGRDTQLVEELREGQPTGSLIPRVTFHDMDKEGKAVVLELSPTDAVKRMKEMAEFLNLFKVEGTGGAGLRTQPAGKKIDLRELAKDPAAYRKAKADGLI